MAYSRPVASLSLSAGLRASLTSAGFWSVADLAALTPLELSKEAKVSPEDALRVLTLVRPGKPNSTTASAALAEEQDRMAIITSCSELDDMLGKGVPLGRIVEICGPPGAGKTQLGIQLAVNVQIPEVLEGCGGEALYIDTEGSFIPQRAEEIARVTADDINRRMSLRSAAERTDFVDMTELDILDRIHYFRIHNHVELIALVNILDEVIDRNPKIRLVVIDSIAFHFRLNFKDMTLRTRLLNRIALGLGRVADGKRVAVVMTNQMTTKFEKEANNSFGGSGQVVVDSGSKLIPALGESWGHCCAIRVMLFSQSNIRRAMLVKSPLNQEQVIDYVITPDGIRSRTGVLEC